jgi:hypothetical protein
MADYFICYTQSDRDWAFCIAKELEALDHTAYIHEWEIKGGQDIYAWVESRVDTAHHILCVVLEEYLKAPYSTLERRAGLYVCGRKATGFRSAGRRQAMPASVAPLIGGIRFAGETSSRYPIRPHRFPIKSDRGLISCPKEQSRPKAARPHRISRPTSDEISGRLTMRCRRSARKALVFSPSRFPTR